MITSADLTSPLGPLRRETFRDPSEAVFGARVDNLVSKAQLTVGRKITDINIDVDDAVEALSLALAFEMAASIWAGLPKAESVSGEVSLEYLSPEELRKEAALYAERYTAIMNLLLTPVGEEPPPRRSGRLRRV